MIIIDGHDSHQSAEFDKYCEDNNIITVGMPPHSSHLLQPLDVALYSPLKRAYGDEINLFIKARINHITKSKFFPAFMAAHFKIFTETNIKARFKGAGIVPFDLEAVISKLDVHLRTPTPPVDCLGVANGWESQTPSNPQQTVLQSNFIKNKISTYQGSSPTPIIDAVDHLAKGAQAMAHSITLLTKEVRTLQDANVALSKRRRAKRSRVQLGGALSIKQSQAILAEKDKKKRPAADGGENSSPSKRAKATVRRCGVCGETGHNARTCSKDVELSNETDSD